MPFKFSKSTFVYIRLVVYPILGLISSRRYLSFLALHESIRPPQYFLQEPNIEIFEFDEILIATIEDLPSKRVCVSTLQFLVFMLYRENAQLAIQSI